MSLLIFVTFSRHGFLELFCIKDQRNYLLDLSWIKIKQKSRHWEKRLIYPYSLNV